jgi:hypothetical protein
MLADILAFLARANQVENAPTDGVFGDVSWIAVIDHQKPSFFEHGSAGRAVTAR